MATAFPYQEILTGGFLRQSPSDTTPSFQVSYFFNNNQGGPFFIGGANNTINLRPRIDMDYSVIAGWNCTTCPF